MRFCSLPRSLLGSSSRDRLVEGSSGSVEHRTAILVKFRYVAFLSAEHVSRGVEEDCDYALPQLCVPVASIQADIPELEPEHVDPEPKLSRGRGGPKLTLFSLLLLLLPIMISNSHQNISKP